MADFFSRLRGNKTEDIEPLMAQGRAHLSARDYSAALADFDEVLKLAPGHAPALSRKSEALYQLGQLEEALDAADQAIEADPEVAATWLARARPLYDLRRLEEAIESCDKAIQLFPALAEAYAFKGAVLMQSGSPRMALRLFEKTLELEPDNPDYHFNRGNALVALGLIKKAIVDFERTLDLAPNDAEAWFNLGNAYSVLQQIPSAIAAFDRALEVDPGLIPAWINKAAAWLDQNETEAAKTSIDEGLQVNSRNPELSIYAVRLERMQGQPQQALERLRQLGEDAVNDPLIQTNQAFELAHTLRALNRSQEAFAQYQAANEVLRELPDWRVFEPQRFQKKVELNLSVYQPAWFEELTSRVKEDVPADQAPVFMVGLPNALPAALDRSLRNLSGDALTLVPGSALSGVINRLRNVPKRSYPAMIARINPDNLPVLREQYLQSVASLEGVLLDMRMVNILELPLIYRLFPEARIVLVVRYPMNQILDGFMHRMQPSDLAKNFTTPGGAVSLYDQVMRLVLAIRQSLPLNHHVLKFEACHEESETTLAELGAFMGLPEGTLPRILPESVAALAEPPVDWRSFEAELVDYQSVLEPWTDYWGYTD